MTDRQWHSECRHKLACGWSGRAIARSLGLHHSTVHRWVRRRHVEALCAFAIAKELGVAP
jgi:IS30 family transposase